jgi:hypothetical protein
MQNEEPLARFQRALKYFKRVLNETPPEALGMDPDSEEKAQYTANLELPGIDEPGENSTGKTVSEIADAILAGLKPEDPLAKKFARFKLTVEDAKRNFGQWDMEDPVVWALLALVEAQSSLAHAILHDVESGAKH